jgi:hypothetical protein
MGFTTDSFRWQLLADMPDAPGPNPRALDRFRGPELGRNIWLVALRLPINPAEPPVALLNLYNRHPENDGSIWMAVNYFTGIPAEVRDATIELTERLMEEGLYHGDLDGGAEIVPMTRTLRAVMDVDAAGDPGEHAGPPDPDEARIKKTLRRTLLHGEVDDARLRQKATINITARTALLGGAARVALSWRLNVKGPGRRPRA